MIYRKDLIDHFEWLAGSEYLEEALDEALIAIALCARGHRADMMKFGAAWVMASYNVERYQLEEFVERERRDNFFIEGDEAEPFENEAHPWCYGVAHGDRRARPAEPDGPSD